MESKFKHIYYTFISVYYFRASPFREGFATEVSLRMPLETVAEFEFEINLIFKFSSELVIVSYNADEFSRTPRKSLLFAGIHGAVGSIVSRLE